MQQTISCQPFPFPCPFPPPPPAISSQKMRRTQKGRNRPLLLFLPIPSLSTTSPAHVMPLLSLSPSCPRSRSSSLVAPLKCSTACLGAGAVIAGLALPPPCAGFCIWVCPDPPPPGARAAAVIPPLFSYRLVSLSRLLLAEFEEDRRDCDCLAKKSLFALGNDPPRSP